MKNRGFNKIILGVMLMALGVLVNYAAGTTSGIIMISVGGIMLLSGVFESRKSHESK